MENQVKRHKFLTVWLSLMLLMNLIVAITYLVTPEKLQHVTPNIPLSFFYSAGILAIFNLICVILLFRWRKMGFWGFCLSAILAVLVNAKYGATPVPQAIFFSAFSILMLFWALNMGKENKAWSRLR